MAAIQEDQDRLALLSQAIDLCQSLAALLRQLGPKNSSDVLQQDGPRSSRQEQIRTMEGALDRAFRAAIEARNQVLAPVSRISDDVLRLLLLHSQSNQISPSDGLYPAFWRMRKRSDHPYTLSSVCRRWRNVALDTAPLWSCLYLKAPENLARTEDERKHPRCRNREVVIGKLPQLSLLRSRDALLTVEVDIWAFTSLSEALQSFTVSCTNRVKDLRIGITKFPAPIDLSTALQVYNHCIQSTAATLTRLSLGRLPPLGPNPAHYEQALNSLFSTGLPQLHEAEFSWIPFTKAPRFEIIASCRVLSMHCSPEERFSWQCCEALFRTCDQLEDIKLALYQYDGSIDSGYSSPRISMSRVHSFSINYEQCENISFPFSMLRLPNLRTLDVSRSILLLDLQPAGGNFAFQHATIASPPDLLSSALIDAAQNSTSLRSFSVQNIPPNVLHQALPQLAAVRTFTLVYKNPFGAYSPEQIHRLYVEVLTSLVQDHSSSASFILPDLDTLDLGSSASMDILFFLHGFLAKRDAASLPIQVLRLSNFSRDSSTPPSLENAWAIEEKVASLVSSFSVTEGDWRFDKIERAWKQHGSTHASDGMRL